MGWGWFHVIVHIYRGPRTTLYFLNFLPLLGFWESDSDGTVYAASTLPTLGGPDVLSVCSLGWLENHGVLASASEHRDYKHEPPCPAWTTEAYSSVVLGLFNRETTTAVLPQPSFMVSDWNSKPAQQGYPFPCLCDFNLWIVLRYLLWHLLFWDRVFH